MQRNKLIYALADTSLVVSSDFNKGGTWAGAGEQLDKLKFVPVFIRSSKTESEPLAPVDVVSDVQPPAPAFAPASEGPPPVTAEALAPTDEVKPLPQPELTPADVLFAAVRASIQQVLTVPMKDAEVAAALDVSNAQAKAWLQRLVDESVLEKRKKPAGYIVKQKRLFE
jgi:DNA processing protein